MSQAYPIEVNCGGIKCNMREDGTVLEGDKFNSHIDVEPICVKGVPCVFIMTDESKRAPYGSDRKYYQLMVVKLTRFNYKLFATHIFDKRSKKYRELNPDTDMHVARACAHKLGVKMAGYYLWPLVATEKVGSWNVPVEGAPLLLARVYGMSSTDPDNSYTFDAKLEPITRPPQLMPTQAVDSKDSWQLSRHFNVEQKELIYNHSHCIREVIDGKDYNVYRGLVMLLPEDQYQRAKVVGHHLQVDSNGHNSIGPLSPADIELAKEQDFSIDYSFAKTPGVTLSVTLKIDPEVKYGGSSRHGGDDYYDSDDDFNDDIWYGYHGDPYFTRKFFFPYMGRVPVNYLDLLQHKLERVLHPEFGDHDITGKYDYYATLNVKIIDVIAVDENEQEVPVPHTGYFRRSDPDWYGEDWDDPYTKVYQFKVERRQRR